MSPELATLGLVCYIDVDPFLPPVEPGVDLEPVKCHAQSSSDSPKYQERAICLIRSCH